MSRRRKSLFERLTGVVRFDDEEDIETEAPLETTTLDGNNEQATDETYWAQEPQEEEEGHLTIDMYESGDAIIIKTIVAGVSPDDLDVTITREMVTVRGRRVMSESVPADNYYFQELYWGSFSRSIVLPQEIEVEEAEAVERYGILEIKLPKINKNREAKVRVKTG
ncbi:MAG: Hsp20/alpha crystallin family protein [Candidatus Paceibacterota bacterium]